MKHALIDLEKTRQLREKMRDGMLCFSVLTALGLIFIFISFLITNGGSINNVFHRDTIDTGMDFFNSLAETAGGTPYTVYGTLYPPLANLFFYILQRCVPNTVSSQWADTHSGIVGMRATALDLRVRQAPMILFIFYMLFTVILLMVIIEAVTNEKTKILKAFSIACCFCYGNIVALERGNIILLSMVFALIFVFFRNSENRLMREFALISLAVSAGLKLYPAILGILLIKDKQWKRAARTIIYGILAFVLPFFAFEGVSAIKTFFRILFSFSGRGESDLGGYGFGGIFNAVYEIVNYITGNPVPFQPIISALLRAAILFCLLLVLCCTSAQWTAILSLTLMLVFVQRSGGYTLTYFLIPFIAFLRENPRINRKNAYPYLFFFAVLLPYLTPKIYLWHTLREAIVASFLLTITVYMAVEEVREMNRRQTKDDGVVNLGTEVEIP